MWICAKCGEKNGKVSNHATFHDGDPNNPMDCCGWCGKKESLTQPRDFKYPKLHASPRHTEGEEGEN